MNTYLNMLAAHYGTADAAAQTPALHTASAADIFGPLSQRAIEAAAAAEPLAEGLASTSVFHATALLLLICYTVVLYRHPELPASLREYIFSPLSARDKLLNDNRHDPLRSFSWGYLLLGVLFFIAAAVRAADLLAPEFTTALPETARMLTVPAAAILFFALLAFQHLMLALSGTVTVSQPLTTALIRVKTIYFRLATVFVTPVLLLWALSPAGGSRIFGTVIALEVLMTALVFLRETILLFISKKLSIYHWILYLCTIEVFPVSFVCLLAARG